eukprot:SM000059S18707  [mRNA]  locus=s59:565707:573182:- [translate_table: standard]
MSRGSAATSAAALLRVAAAAAAAFGLLLLLVLAASSTAPAGGAAQPAAPLPRRQFEPRDGTANSDIAEAYPALELGTEQRGVHGRGKGSEPGGGAGAAAGEDSRRKSWMAERAAGHQLDAGDESVQPAAPFRLVALHVDAPGSPFRRAPHASAAAYHRAAVASSKVRLSPSNVLSQASFYLHEMRQGVHQMALDQCLTSCRHWTQAREEVIHRRLLQGKDGAGGGGLSALSAAFAEAVGHLDVAGPEGGVNITSNVYSGFPAGLQAYYTKMRIGTPPQEVIMFLDTGSDLPWVQCLPCSKCYVQSGPIFDPARSASFQNVSCTAPACAVAGFNSTADCATSNSSTQRCPYAVLYGDGSNSTGFLSQDTMSFIPSATSAAPLQLHDVIFGCGNAQAGGFVLTGGLLGLGRASSSFPSQLEDQFGACFSTCLSESQLGSPLSGHLEFGGASILTRASNVTYTRLLPDPHFYAVKAEGLLLGGQLLEISLSTWEAPTAFDTGTTYSLLVGPAYAALVQAMDRNQTRAPLSGGVCYEILGNTSTQADLDNYFPALTFRFDGPSDFIMSPRSYLLRVAPQIACLGVLPGGFNLIGNLAQQNVLLVYDRQNLRLGWTATNCSSLDLPNLRDVQASLGSPSYLTSNWTGLDPCRNWVGVSCNQEGRVISLNLDSLLQLGSSMPNSLSALTELTYLSLASNNMTGVIPRGICQLPKLTVLSLSNNRLQGAVPHCLAALPNLTKLKLDGNNFTGTIPSELGALTGLVTLLLAGNSLTGSIPPSFAKLTSLVKFSVANNLLSGLLPARVLLSVYSNPSLVYLDVSSNYFTGLMPSALLGTLVSNRSAVAKYGNNCLLNLDPPTVDTTTPPTNLTTTNSSGKANVTSTLNALRKTRAPASVGVAALSEPPPGRQPGCTYASSQAGPCHRGRQRKGLVPPAPLLPSPTYQNGGSSTALNTSAASPSTSAYYNGNSTLNMTTSGGLATHNTTSTPDYATTSNSSLEHKDRGQLNGSLTVSNASSSWNTTGGQTNATMLDANSTQSPRGSDAANLLLNSTGSANFSSRRLPPPQPVPAPPPPPPSRVQRSLLECANYYSELSSSLAPPKVDNQSLLVNFGFELPRLTDVGKLSRVFTTDNGTIPGWVLTAGSICIMERRTNASRAELPSEGNQSLVLNSVPPSSIHQYFDTLAGASYSVSLDHATSISCNPPYVRRFKVTVNSGGSKVFEQLAGGNTSSAAYVTLNFRFTARSGRSSLTFVGVTTYPRCSTAIDNVLVVRVR